MLQKTETRPESCTERAGGERTRDGARRPSQAGSDCHRSGTALKGCRQGCFVFREEDCVAERRERRGGGGGKSRSRGNRMRPRPVRGNCGLGLVGAKAAELDPRGLL